MHPLESWGRCIVRRRWWVLLGSIGLLVATVAVLGQGGHLAEKETVDTEARRANNLIAGDLPHGPDTTGFAIVFSNSTLSARSAAFRAAVQQALAPLAADPHVGQVVTPFTPSAETSRLFGADGHSAVAEVVIQDTPDRARAYYPQLRSLVHSDMLQIAATGGLPLERDYNRLLDEGLAKAGSLALPLTLLLLLLVFGTLVAAALPLGIGLLTISGATAIAFLISRWTSVSPSTTEFIAFLGLGLAVDYSLFIVNRFREELRRGRSVEDALSRTLATSGRAILFSGLTVMAGLSGLFFYSGTWLAEIAAPLVALVALTLVYGLTLLPALLALLGRRIDSLRLPLPRRTSGGVWHRLASWVARRPLRVLAPTLACVAIAASPLASINLATDHGSSLPAMAESRRGAEVLLASFPQLTQASIPIVINYAAGNPLSATHAGELYDLTRKIQRVPGVVGIESVVSVAPGSDRSSVVRMLSGTRSEWPAALQSAAHKLVGGSTIVLYVSTNKLGQSDAERQVVRSIRALRAGVSGALLVTGEAAFDMDRTAWIAARSPLALGFVVAVTMLIVFVLVRSVILPVKAVLTNLLSISVAFGAMVWIFQQGHLAGVLGFTPGPIDPTVPVAMFCIVFGVSMDYEVFILSRIQEEHRLCGDNTLAVARGLERCGRLVTYAAAIMCTVLSAFAIGDVTVIKTVGLGTAIAVAVDATVMRGLLVPAAMVLMGRLNWWAPRWLQPQAAEPARQSAAA